MIYYIPLPAVLRLEKMNVKGAKQLSLTTWRIERNFQLEVEEILINNSIPFVRKK